MPIDTTPPTPPEPAPDIVVAEPDDDTRTDPPDPVPDAAQGDEEAMMLWREGLPPDGVILAPSIAATPMRHPENVWGMLVVAADVLDATDPDREGEVALFAGCWLREQPPASRHEGDLVLALTAPDAESPPEDLVDVEMLLAHQNRWLRVGEWEGMDPRWPWTVALTASAIMGLHTEATETTLATSGPTPPAISRSLQGWGGNGGIRDLLDAGLVHADDEFIWDRPGRGARHTARIHATGTLVLADGRTFVSPSGALTALGGKHQNGWKAWKRTSDGRLLGDLRADLRINRGLPGEPQRR